jgi:hypothetical protein
MKQYLRDLIPTMVGARTSLAQLLVLIAVPVFLGTGTASAQFGVDNGRSDRAGAGMRDEGRRGSGVGIGIGIGVGIGEALVDKAARDDAKSKSGAGATARTSGPRRAARKGDGDKPAGKPPKKDEAKKKDEDAPPTAFPNDPADGIEVPGGKVHRGTGTITGYKGGDRKGIYCWVHITDKEKCKKTAQYQFVTVNVEAKWGSDAQANINDLVKKVRANDGGFLPVTANGVYAMPGQLVGDDYKGTRNENPVKIKDPNGKDISAGPYPPQKIPGGDGDKGLIDAPYWKDTIGGLAGGLAPESLRKQKKVQATQPADSDAGTITVLQHFQTYVYCMEPKACLGYFEWDYNETITIVMKWQVAKKSSDVADKTFGDNMQSGGDGKKKGKGQPAEQPEDKTWTPYFEAKGNSKVDGPTIGEWKPCP